MWKRKKKYGNLHLDDVDNQTWSSLLSTQVCTSCFDYIRDKICTKYIFHHDASFFSLSIFVVPSVFSNVYVCTCINTVTITWCFSIISLQSLQNQSFGMYVFLGDPELYDVYDCVLWWWGLYSWENTWISLILLLLL